MEGLLNKFLRRLEFLLRFSVEFLSFTSVVGSELKLLMFLGVLSEEFSRKRLLGLVGTNDDSSG